MNDEIDYMNIMKLPLLKMQMEDFSNIKDILLLVYTIEIDQSQYYGFCDVFYYNNWGIKVTRRLILTTSHIIQIDGKSYFKRF